MFYLIHQNLRYMKTNFNIQIPSLIHTSYRKSKKVLKLIFKENYY